MNKILFHILFIFSLIFWLQFYAVLNLFLGSSGEYDEWIYEILPAVPLFIHVFMYFILGCYLHLRNEGKRVIEVYLTVVYLIKGIIIITSILLAKVLLN